MRNRALAGPMDRRAGDARSSRRCFLTGSVTAVVAAALGVPAAGAAPLPSATVLIEEFWDDGSSKYASQVPRIVRTDTQWRALLSPLAFEVMRRGATEPAYSGAYLHNRRQGVYRCIGCGTALFSSRDKYDARRGWPSFRRAISRYNVAESLGDDTRARTDRLAVACRRCAGHLGTVSADGPAPSVLRYSIDSVALRFAASSRY